MRIRGRPARLAAAVLALSGAMAGLSACTTVEGSNALVNFDTFEREVMSETLKGVGIIPREDPKEALNAPRGPLVEPPNSESLPAPTESMASMLPEDSDNPLLDPTGLTDEEVRLIRGARVLDEDFGSGRALTPREATIIAERLRLRRELLNASRGQDDYPLEMPPLHVFTTVGDREFICLAESGELVALDDPACPPAVREALQNGQ